MITALFVVYLQCALAAVAFAATGECPTSPVQIPAELNPRANIGKLKLEIINYICFGEYDRDVDGVMHAARLYLESRLDPANDKLAIVLDIDETSLSNRVQYMANDFSYIPTGACAQLPQGPCGTDTWEGMKRATAFQGTLDLVRFARAHKVAVFFITGRTDKGDERQKTADNLQAAGYGDYTALYLRPDGRFKNVQEFKTFQRNQITGQGYAIVVNAGDQESDLAGEDKVERKFKVPNPMYFIP